MFSVCLSYPDRYDDRTCYYQEKSYICIMIAFAFTLKFLSYIESNVYAIYSTLRHDKTCAELSMYILPIKYQLHANGISSYILDYFLDNMGRKI